MKWKNMSTAIRQSALVTSSGPGSLSVLKDGRTVLLPGVDSWYVPLGGKGQVIPGDAVVKDNLLAEALWVKHFVAPPAEGVSEDNNSGEGIIGVTLFPKWTVCTNAGCGTMRQLGGPELTLPRCATCLEKSKGRGWKTVQSNFLVACEDGHLSEFPWLEWVHRGTGEICAQPKLRFAAKGIAELGKQTVWCSCGQKRSLARTNELSENGSTFLSENLATNGEPFLCSGTLPWLGVEAKGCDRPLRMLLRNQSNLYFASTISSILVPEPGTQTSPIVEVLEKPGNIGKIKGFWAQGQGLDDIAVTIRVLDPVLQAFTPSQIAQALTQVLDFPDGDAAGEEDALAGEYDRKPEWDALRKPVESKNLVVRDCGWNGDFPRIETVLAVPLLKKTTALQGFSRIFPASMGGSKGKQLLRRNPFSKGQSSWLPGVQHRGEGIFVSLDLAALENWEKETSVVSRVQPLVDVLESKGASSTGVIFSPRFVLLHTLAHLLIQELVFECGYTSAALGERIYSGHGQAGILIFTASSSGDGTMGGLVEMAEPIRLKKVLQDAIASAQWCSNDPVCMESSVSGQNSSGANLAACFNCSLIPETACDHFNQGLDRALIVGDLGPDSSKIAFFD